MISLFADVKTVLADIEAEASKGKAALTSEAKVVEATLAPVMSGFITQAEGIAKQIGSTAFNALVTQATSIAKSVESNTTLTTGTAKFAAFMTELETWAKTEAPAVMALAGPAFRSLLEMTISAATTAGVAAVTGAAPGAVAVAAAAGAVAEAGKLTATAAAAPAVAPAPVAAASPASPAVSAAPNAAAAPAAPTK